MKKLIFASSLIFALSFLGAAEKSSNTVRFLKGNISDKTAAVREAFGDEGVWLSSKALEFAIENKQLIGSDRDLDGLAVSAILSVPDDYFSRQGANASLFINYFSEIFNKFQDSGTVQIAVLQKIVLVKDKADVSKFTSLLNGYVQNVSPGFDSAVIKAALNCLENIGDRETFVILYNMWNNRRFSAFYDDIEKALVSLTSISANEVIQIVRSKDLNQICKVFALAQKNSKISKNLLCEIAEISLSESILLVDSASKFTNEADGLQSQCLDILEENSWTRASSVAIDYLRFCKKMLDNGLIKDDYFARVVSSMSDISPIESVNQLCAFLEEFNNRKEKNDEVSPAVVKAVIETLGAIGNKSAFDYLLAVTYLSYPEDILSAAREALAGLRWQ